MRERAKRLRGCRCDEPKAPGGTYARPCHWGNCTEWRCTECDGLLGSAGEIWCRCDGGCYRAFRHPGMENPHYAWSEKTGRVYSHVAVKASKARRSQAGRHNQRRRR